jgi:NADPH:quinone reductase-like Zn-dependent oxidoreductase
VRLRKSAAAQIEGSIEAEVREKENSMQQGTGLQNKRVVILGGSSGIGLAVVEQEASQGARIIIASSNVVRLQKAVAPFGGNATRQPLSSRTNRPSKLTLPSLVLSIT